MPGQATPQRLHGIWIPLITPFSEQPGLPIDHASLEHLASDSRSAGVHGLVIGGTTGEAAALTRTERAACWRTVAKAAPGLPLMLGTGGHGSAEALQDLQWLRSINEQEGLALQAVLLAAPAYVRPAPAGLELWFRTLADAAPAPVVIYDIPYRTGATLPRDLLLGLGQHPNIVGVKDCGGDLGKTLALIHDGRLQVMAGEDLQLMAHLTHGGAGCISASAHLHTERWVELYQHMKTGHLDAARMLWQKLVPLIETAFAEPNPGPLKAALALQGRATAAVRPPMTQASPALHARWKEVGLGARLSPP